MSKYTTGEIAKLCGVSVRTVQYYDSRGILIPGDFSEGGRRLYSESDLKKLKIICFLREAGISINCIGELFNEQDPYKVILLLISQRQEELAKAISDSRTQLDMLSDMEKEVKRMKSFSVDSIGDIAHAMNNRKKMKRIHSIMLITGLPFCIMQWVGIYLIISAGIWQILCLHIALSVPYAVWVSKFYFTKLEYLCPNCHEVFRPSFKEAFWAKHTPTLRKLSCPHCGHNGLCLELCRDDMH